MVLYISMYLCIYNTTIWYYLGQKFGGNVNLTEIKFGENVKILIVVVELQNVWRIKFAKIHQTFVLYDIELVTM